MRILVTGGRGHLGSALTPILIKQGHTVRVSSRSPKPNRPLDVEWAQMQIGTGEGVEQALDGVDAVMHLASTPMDRKVDIEGARHLLEIGKQKGVSHFVYMSIVGIDKVPFSYYKIKLAAEDVIRQSDVPWTILRATQFFPFIDIIFSSMNKLPIGILPLEFKTQPISVQEVAQHLAEVVNGEAKGMMPEIGGPEVFTLREMAKDWLAVRNMRRPLINVPVFGKTGAGFRGGLITTPNNRYGRVTWHEWLEDRYGSTVQSHVTA